MTFFLCDRFVQVLITEERRGKKREEEGRRGKKREKERRRGEKERRRGKKRQTMML